MRLKQVIPWIFGALFITMMVLHPISFSSHSSTTSSINSQGEKITTTIVESQMNASPQGLIFLGVVTLIWMFFKPPVKPVTNDGSVKKSRRGTATTIDYSLLFVSTYFFGVVAILLTEAIETGQWQWSWYRNEATGRDWIFLIPLIIILTFAYRRLRRTLREGRPTIGLYMQDIRLISDPNEPPPTTGRLLAAYAGHFKSGEDLWKRMRLSYRPEIREQGTIVRAVSTRSP